MTTRLKIFITCFALALLVANALFDGAVSSGAARAQAQEAQSAARALTPQERRGKVIYLRGETASGREIGALIGEIDVPASTLTCAGCHGTRGEGKTEGGVTAGNLTWANLVKPYGHTHPTGRKHGPFDEAAFARTVATGVDPDGNKLLVAMPRYKMAVEDMADLVAYLKRIESERDPGLTESSIKIGALLPAKGALAETGAAMKDVLAAYFADLNERGGIYNRKIELRIAEGGDAAASVAAARASIKQEQVFAFVGGMSAGADKELSALAREEEVPFVGPATLLPQVETPPNRYVFYTLPGVAEQSRALANFAASRPELRSTRAVILHAENEIASAAASAAEDQARKSGLSAITKQSYARGTFDAARVAQTLKAQGVGAVFFYGYGGEDVALLKEAAAIEWTPHVFLLGALAARELSATLPPVFKDKVFLSFPTVPSDITAEALAELRALVAKYKFAARHTASQLSALAAAKIFVEGLKRAGRELTRESLVTALEGLYDYETGLTPRMTFGPNRRVGAAGSYILTIDPDKKEFVLTGGWVKAY
jgi:ABC-type branched-subunit amino acid transport system substrate-binding protein